MNILFDLAENAESESVRLGATRDLLDRAGFRPVDRHEIVKEKSVEELNAGVTKRASIFKYIILSTYTGEIFGFINFEHLNPMGELWQILT